MSPRLPKMCAGLDINETDDGLIVYQESTDRVHHLNQTAAVVFQLCDGSHELEEIAESVGKLFDLSEPPALEVEACLENLAREGLIV
jgi:hypothetical protein